MRTSEYTDEDKRNIVQVIMNRSESIIKSCEKQKISIPTYYQWKREIEGKSKSAENYHIAPKSSQEGLIMENSTLRKLYINLSEHNHELAKFLNNQL